MKISITRILAVLSILTLTALNPMAASAQRTEAADNNNYVAIGDSVAAGAGLPLNAADPEAALCGKSAQSYPFLVAQSTGMPLSHEACGGATILSGILGAQPKNGTNIPPQIDKAFANGTPKLITLTVGTNDIQWSSYLGKCYTSTCGSWTDTKNTSYLIWRVHQNLRQTLNAIADRSGGNPPHVIITGYFQPLSNDQPACRDTTGLTEDEISWIRRQDSLLNIALHAMQYEYSFVDFAPVDFTGHELCSPNPWIQGLGAPASYHPTAAGQTAIATSILNKL